MTDRRPPRSPTTVLTPGHHRGQPDPVRPRRRLPAAARRGPAVRPQGHGRCQPDGDRHRVRLRCRERSRSQLGTTAVTTSSWTRHEDRLHRADAMALRSAAVRITNGADGLSSYNGLTVQVLDAVRPRPGRTPAPTRGWPRSGRASRSHTVQAALEAARPTTREAGTGWSSCGRTPQTADNPHGRVQREPHRAPPGAASRVSAPAASTARRDVRPRLDPRRCRASTPTTPAGPAWISAARRADATPVTRTCRTPRWSRCSTTRRPARAERLPGRDRRVPDHRRRAVGLPGQHQRAHRRGQDAVRRDRCARHPGRRHLRAQQRARAAASPTT